MANVAAHFTSQDGFSGEPDTRKETVHIVIAAGALVFAAFLTYLLFATSSESLQATMDTLRPFTLLAFIAALVAFYAGVNAQSLYYPLVLFGLLLEAVQSLFFVLWIVATSFLSMGLSYSLYAPVYLGTMMVFSLVFGLVLLISSILSLLRGPRLDAGPPPAFVRDGETISKEELKERERVKTYFKSKPKWPWLLVYASLVAGSMAMAQYTGGESIYFPYWVLTLETMFLLSVRYLISDGGRTVKLFDPATFFIGAKTVDSVHEAVVTRWIAPAYGGGFWAEMWPIYTARLMVATCIAMFLYALIYRFIIYRRARRATDQEVDHVVNTDLKSMTDRALAHLGLEPAQLISPPLALRGLPDVKSVEGAFVGVRIGKDDVLRFTPQRTTLLGFTNDQVHYYEGTVDITTGRIIHESMAEFFYQDVSNVARANATQSIGLRQAWSLRDSFIGLFSRRRARRRDRIFQLAVGDTVQFEGKDLFQINLESGRELVVVLRDDSFFDKAGKRFVSMLRSLSPIKARSAASASSLYRSEVPIDDNERVMRAVRTLIRDKKRALLQERV